MDKEDLAIFPIELRGIPWMKIQHLNNQIIFLATVSQDHESHQVWAKAEEGKTLLLGQVTTLSGIY